MLEMFAEYFWSFNVMRIISQGHFGGGQFSEIYETVRRIREGDRDSWHIEWAKLAEATETLGREADQAGHTDSATARFSRATEYWRMADFMLPPSDPRRLPAYKRSLACFASAMPNFPTTVERVHIPYERTTMPGYFIHGAGQEPGRARATVLFFGGADSTAEELYFTAPGIWARGYSCLIVDGPGQGATLRLQGIASRFDYEVPVSAAIDYVVGRPEVDANRLILCAMSLGGYYAARAAAFEHRLRATIIWGALYDYSWVWDSRPDNHPMADHATYLFGARNITEAREIMKQFNLNGILHQVSTPTLVVHGEDDRSVKVEHAHRTYEELGCDKELMLFPSGSSGSAHCQQDNLTKANELIFDWLLDRVPPTSEGIT